MKEIEAQADLHFPYFRFVNQEGVRDILIKAFKNGAEFGVHRSYALAIERLRSKEADDHYTYAYFYERMDMKPSASADWLEGQGEE